MLFFRAGNTFVIGVNKKEELMKTNGIIAILGVSIVLALGACHKNDNSSMNNSDREFMDRMAFTLNEQVTLGNLATSKGSDASIKSFGQEMVTSHTPGLNDLKTLAQQRNYGLSSNMDAEHIALKLVLDGESGRKFDSIYIKGQVKDHAQALEIIDDELSKGKDAGLKDYANKYRPMMQAHKSSAEAIVGTMGF